MITNDFFTAWNETRTISKQIANNLPDDKLSWRPHEDMKPLGDLTTHLIGSIYHMFKNYLKRDVATPEAIKSKQPYNKAMFKHGLEETDTMVQTLFSELTMDDLSNEAYTWTDAQGKTTSYSVGWVVFTLISHERWTQAQLKMYLKLMGVDTSPIGH